MDKRSFKRHQRVIAMPGHLLRRCQQIAVAVFLDECAPLKLTPMQFIVLSALAGNGPTDQASLAGLTAIDRTTVQVVLRKLCKLGLTTRTRSRVDKRAKIIQITANGLARLNAAMPLVERAQERILGPLNANERATLLRLLRTIAHENNAESRAPYRTPRVRFRNASKADAKLHATSNSMAYLPEPHN
jgi:MarR family transcriptional regulator, lower aerobic nicotinate degradation pathway regulator